MDIDYSWIQGGAHSAIVPFANELVERLGKFPPVLRKQKVYGGSPAALWISGGAPLFLLSGETVPPATALHEILHAWRFYAKAIPRVMACSTLRFQDDFGGQELTDLDNAIEHSIIRPISKLHGLDDSESFDAEAVKQIRSLTPDDLQGDANIFASLMECRGLSESIRVEYVQKCIAAGKEESYKNIQALIESNDPSSASGKVKLVRELVTGLGW